jgi:hypothetical protein
VCGSDESYYGNEPIRGLFIAIAALLLDDLLRPHHRRLLSLRRPLRRLLPLLQARSQRPIPTQKTITKTQYNQNLNSKNTHTNSLDDTHDQTLTPHLQTRTLALAIAVKKYREREEKRREGECCGLIRFCAYRQEKPGLVRKNAIAVRPISFQSNVPPPAASAPPWIRTCPKRSELTKRKEKMARRVVVGDVLSE